VRPLSIGIERGLAQKQKQSNRAPNGSVYTGTLEELIAWYLVVW